MNKFEVNELLDFYSCLLTEKQQEICNAYYHLDYSYQEIGENMNISRSAVYDAIKRCKQELMQYEEKLHLNALYKKRHTIYKKIKESNDVDSIHAYIDMLENEENGGNYEL